MFCQLLPFYQFPTWLEGSAINRCDLVLISLEEWCVHVVANILVKKKSAASHFT